MKKWLGIDYGKSRIGVAVSDALGITARGVETIKWNGRDWEKPLERLTALLGELGAEGIVLGLPRRTDGRPGESEDSARELAVLLEERTGIKPVLYDERYTTVLAHRVLREAPGKKRDTRSIIDQVAAEILLAEFLEGERKRAQQETPLI